MVMVSEETKKLIAECNTLAGKLQIFGLRYESSVLEVLSWELGNGQKKIHIPKPLTKAEKELNKLPWPFPIPSPKRD